MPHENGGRADKNGNRFEVRWILHQLLEVLNEKIEYVMYEALGDDEQGVDVWLGKKDGSCECQQCKSRNGSLEYWNYGTANTKGIFTDWLFQLERNNMNTVSLVSPLSFQLIDDIISRAKTNSNPSDFYNYQIKESGKEVIAFFESICKAWKLDPNNDKDLIKIVNYFKRILYRQSPDAELKNIVLDKISFLLIGNVEEIYAKFITWIIDGSNYGKRVDIQELYNFLDRQEISLRNLALDKRIAPAIEEINRKYRSKFLPLKEGLIERKEFEISRRSLNAGESIIIHGRAGRGKSGCTEDIIDYCIENKIPYIAIKLDEHVPSKTSEKWGVDLGLPASIPHCIDSISGNRKAVIILDQLDALRWTQAHSKDALSICGEIINQVGRLNSEREQKLSIVLACRTYDLENDNNIKGLLSDKKGEMVWKRIEIDEFDDSIVKRMVGNSFNSLTKRLKDILKVPSNLYIWQQLDEKQTYTECTTTYQLIVKWWEQLVKKGFESGIPEIDINTTKNKLVANMEQKGRLYATQYAFSENHISLSFLSSNGFLVIQGDKIFFAHQSILDSLLAQKMLIASEEDKSIEDIIRGKEEQTPSKRYQVQIWLQTLSESDTALFLSYGQRLLESENVRYLIKFVFFEVLNQIAAIDENIKKFVLKNCEGQQYSKHFVGNVFWAKPGYIRILRDRGILERWILDKDKRPTAISLLVSMGPCYETKDVEFIRRHMFSDFEDVESFARCFLHDVSQDTDDFFELRLELYKKYPQLINQPFDIEKMSPNCEVRIAHLLVFLLVEKSKGKEDHVHRYESRLFIDDSDICVEHGREILNILLPYVLEDKHNTSTAPFCGWSNRYGNRSTIERTCIRIIKLANINLIKEDSEAFWELYQPYMGTGNDVSNEIILDGLYNMSESYSNRIIEYLYSNFDSNLFESTSGNGNKVLLAKRVIEKHSQYCSTNIYKIFENKIMYYISERAKERYERRINQRKQAGHIVYWSFWGDLQHEILGILPQVRISENAKALLRVLKRKFNSGHSIYEYSGIHGGTLSSPISGKTLNDRQWLGILHNDKIEERKFYRRKKIPEGFVESSLEEFAASFRADVSKEPERMIRLILSSNKKVPCSYIDALFSGVAYSEGLRDIPRELVEKIILTYPCDNTSYRANYVCEIIEKRKDEKWSQDIIDIVKHIAINHINPKINEFNITTEGDKEVYRLHTNAINCVRGNAASAISTLLWSDKELFVQFKAAIEKLVFDKNPAVQFASLFALWPSYNIDEAWASEKILYLYEHNYQMVVFPGTKQMLFLLYPKYRERVVNIIENCYMSEDEELVKIGGHCLSEMFILKNEFADMIENIDDMNEVQAKAILDMMVLYFNNEKYNDLVKSIMRKFINSFIDLEMPFAKLFYDNRVNLERDKEFMIEVLSSSVGGKILHAFVNYLEEEAKSIVDYKDVILSTSRYLIEKETDSCNEIWGIVYEISKLIVGLYDETYNSCEQSKTAQECLDIWDLMFERDIGSIRMLSQKIMEV